MLLLFLSSISVFSGCFKTKKALRILSAQGLHNIDMGLRRTSAIIIVVVIIARCDRFDVTGA